jgi:hypothetical protein
MKKVQVAKQFQIMRSFQKCIKTRNIPNIKCAGFFSKTVAEYRILRLLLVGGPAGEFPANIFYPSRIPKKNPRQKTTKNKWTKD